MCLAGDVVAPWSLTQEVVGLILFTVMTNVFVTEFIKNIENSLAYTAYQVRSVYPIFIQPMESIEIKK